MVTNPNPRSKQYKQAYAWMNPEQKRHAYLTYLQNELAAVQNEISRLAESHTFSFTLQNKVYKLEAQIAKLEQAEYRRYLEDNERIARIIDRNQKRGY